MDNDKGEKPKENKPNDADDKRREKRSKRVRSRSRSPHYQRREKETHRKRKHSKSRSPVPPKQERQANDSHKNAEVKKEVPVRKPKDVDMVNTRTGGAYIPPARLRMMQAQITDKSSVAYQRLAWEALKKSIHGHINKINIGNIGIIIKELLKENIVRGRGLLCRSVIQAQAASPTFTNVYAALVAAVNSRFPNIGELLLKRLVIQFKRGFKRNDKAICISSTSFIAHLVNQRVAHEILALELLTLLVETPTDDSVEVAIAFLKECGQKLTEVSSKGVNAIFEMLRNILHEGQLDKRVQYMIEVMFQVWKDGFKDHPALIEELELVPEEEQFTHLLMLDDDTDPQDILNVFKFDDKFEENEQKYKTLSKEILGSDAESGEEDGSEGSGSEDSDDEEDEEGEQKAVTIIDNTETNLIALRRTIYLTINSSLDFEECAHKLMKMQLKPGQEIELCHMFLDCCAEQRTYEKFYGLLAQRFCNINRIYIGPFEEIFKDSYLTAHRLDTNRLRNVSKFFAHLLFTDSISWEALECVKLNEEDTTSSSRIYIKILFQELAEYMGLKKLNDRLKDPTLQGAFSGVFPRDNPKNTRFSINFFTSIGLGGLTDELREHLKQMPKNIPAAITEINVDSESSSSSSSDSSSSSSGSSSSDSEEEETNENTKVDKKSKNNKNKETAQTSEEQSQKNKEKWGHDGFYDTYGKDAQRIDSSNKEKDNFARPRDVRRDDRERRDFGQRNGNADRSDRRDDRDSGYESRNRREADLRYDRNSKRQENNYENNREVRDAERSRYEKYNERDRDIRRKESEKNTGGRSRDTESKQSSRNRDDNEQDSSRGREVMERDVEKSRSDRVTEKNRDQKNKQTSDSFSKGRNEVENRKNRDLEKERGIRDRETARNRFIRDKEIEKERDKEQEKSRNNKDNEIKSSRDKNKESDKVRENKEGNVKVKDSDRSEKIQNKDKKNKYTDEHKEFEDSSKSRNKDKKENRNKEYRESKDPSNTRSEHRKENRNIENSEEVPRYWSTKTKENTYVGSDDALDRLQKESRRNNDDREPKHQKDKGKDKVEKVPKSKKKSTKKEDSSSSSSDDSSDSSSSSEGTPKQKVNRYWEFDL